MTPTSLALGTTLAATAFIVSLPGAFAAPMTFTLDPAAAVAGADGTFTATNSTVADYVTINVTGAGSFTESGLINLSAFTNKGASAALPGLDQTYALYVQFIATGTQGSGSVVPAANSTITGTFSLLNFSLIAASGKPTFTATAEGAAVSGLSNAVTVATGSLISGTSTLTNTNLAGLSAAANALITFNPVAPGFFVAPDATMGLDFFTSVNNTGSVLTASGASELVIDGGGGNATLQGLALPVSEPASFLVLGAGLLGLSIIGTRRS